MFRKGFLKNAPSYVQILLLFSTVIFGLLLGECLFIWLARIKGEFNSGNINDFVQYANGNAQLIRQSLFFQTLCGFLFPALILSWMFSDNTQEYLHTEQRFSASVVILTVFGVLSLMPFLNAVVYCTQQIPLPDSMKVIETKITELETQAQRMVEIMLVTDDYFSFLMNLLIVAVLAAVGEEFLFRGVIQNIAGKIFKNPHLVIWTVGIIFSFVHFQFYGFFARMLLGAYLGYLLYYSKSIWLPVLAHFTNNAVGVIGYYSIKDPEILKKIDQIGTGTTLWLAFLSLALFSVSFAVFIRKCRLQNLLP